ncbi:MAG: efflux RND transporter periplasmic adaptor subunit [Pelagibacteraceae bacterium]
MKSKNKLILILSLIALVIIGVIAGRAYMASIVKKKIIEAKSRPVGVIATKVKKSNFYEKLETFGTAIANQSYSIRIKKSELIKSINFDKYPSVKKGQTIAELTTETIIAPFDGKVGKREITPGILGGDDSIIATLDDIKKLKVDVKVPENYLGILKTGLRIEAKSSAFQETFSGSVETISSRVDPTTRSILVQVAIDNKQEKLIPGMLLDIILVFNENVSLGVPEEALIIQGDSKFVYRIKDNKIVRTQVKIGKRNFGKVEILSGLIEDETILAEGTNKVRPNSKIKITKYQ